MENRPEQSGPQLRPRQRVSPSTLGLLLLLAGAMVFLFLRSASPKVAEIKWGLFRRELDENNIAKVEVNGMRLSGEFRSISEGGKGPPIDPDGKADKAGTLPRLPEKFVTVVPPQVMDSASLDDMLLKKLGTELWRDRAPRQLGVYARRVPSGDDPVVRRRVVYVPSHEGPDAWRWPAGRVRQEPGKAATRRATSRSHSRTWPVWRE